MLFKKKRKMIDLRTLQKGGVVKVPQKSRVVQKHSSDFVDLSSKPVSSENLNPFSLLDQQSSGSSQDFSVEDKGYTKREVDAKITELDNKIYRLEQRIELLERKAGVSNASQTSGGFAGGW